MALTAVTGHWHQGHDTESASTRLPTLVPGCMQVKPVLTYTANLSHLADVRYSTADQPRATAWKSDAPRVGVAGSMNGQPKSMRCAPRSSPTHVRMLCWRGFQHVLVTTCAYFACPAVCSILIQLSEMVWQHFQFQGVAAWMLAVGIGGQLGAVLPGPLAIRLQTLSLDSLCGIAIPVGHDH
jgi:hypothetical protein